MKKLNKNIATAVAIAMAISGLAPTAQAYSISNNGNTSLFARIMNMIKAESAIRSLRFADLNGTNLSETEQSVKSGDTLRVKIFGSGSSLNNVLDTDIKIKLTEVDAEGQVLGEVELTPEKITKKTSSTTGNISNIIADIKVPNNETADEKTYKISACVTSDKAYSEGDTTISIKCAGKVSTDVQINSFKASKKSTTETSEEYNFSVQGSNLEKAKLSLLIKDQNNKDVTREIFGSKENILIGMDTTKSVKVTFPTDDLKAGENKTYTISLLSDGKETGKTVTITITKEATSEVVSLIKGVDKEKNVANAAGATIKLILTTDASLKASDILYQITENGNVNLNSEIKIEIKDTTDATKKDVTVTVPATKTSKDKIYSLEFADSTNRQYTVKSTLTHFGNPELAESEIQAVTPMEIKDIQSAGETITFYVMTKGVNKDKLGVKIINETNKEIVINDIKVTGDKAKKTVTMTIPENTESKVKTYKVKFCVDKTVEKPVYNENVVLTITQKAAEAPKVMKVVEFDAPIADIPAKGGTIAVTAKGENLEAKKLSLKVEKLLENGQKEDVTKSVVGSNVFVGEDIITSPDEMRMSSNLTFPALTKEGTIDRYLVTLIVDGKEEFKTIKTTVSEYGTLEETTVFSLAGVYMDGNNKILLECEENLSEVIPGTLKENISLKISTKDKEGEFVKLSEGDKVEIHNNFIIIILQNPIDVENLDTTKSNVKIEKRVLKNSKGQPFGAINWRINKAVPVVHEYEFVNGYILNSKGGEVVVKLKGINLVNPNGVDLTDTTSKATRVRVFKKENLNANIKYLDGITVEGEGKEQTIRFTLPENKGNRTESYSVMISLNNGKTYSAEVGVNMMDSRGTRITPSVLPAGVSDKASTLSFASIQSYGTAGGGKVPDNTHTETPTNQESKKTFVHLYGTNLEKNKTKVRIKHIDTDTTKYPDGTKGTGATFYPTNEPAKDSGDRFTMVAFDGTGIIGDGNHQQLEIIAPRGYRGTNTWEYQFAVDGVNFDEENTVTVTVVNDGEEQMERPLPDEAIRDLTVKYVTTDGKELSKSEIHKVFKGQQFYSSDVAPKEFKGYKYLGVKEVEDAKVRLEELNKKGDNLTSEEKTEKTKLENLFNNVVNQKFKELEMTYSNKPGTEGILTFLYEDLNKPVNPDKPIIPQEPSNPSKPSIPSKPQEKPEEKPGTGVKVEVVDRIAGENRYETSTEISQKVYKSSEKVYLVSGEKFPDALSASALTANGDGPILLVNDKNIDKILAEIDRLDAKEIVFVGGKSISEANEAKVKEFAKDKSSVVSTFVGKDRYETAVKVAEQAIAKFGNKGKVIIVDGRNYPDAVSIAPYASREGLPVLLVNGNKVSKEVKDFLAKNNIKEAIVVGGEKAVGKDVEKLFKNVTRVAGEDRYDTSKKIAEKFFANADKVFVASGESFADSLSVSYYAGAEYAPILLTKSNSLDNDTREYLNANKDKDYIIVGGEEAVNPELFK